jgi:hypothetical protein
MKCKTITTSIVWRAQVVLALAVLVFLAAAPAAQAQGATENNVIFYIDAGGTTSRLNLPPPPFVTLSQGGQFVLTRRSPRLSEREGAR